MRSLLARFIRDEVASTAIEYAIIGAGLSILIVAGVNGIGVNLSGRFSAMSAAIK
ncbi:Flp family type IVb pilin [Bradyrhizobium jicamae]|uniref:Flp family type IVb pilin n=1 Tax=Bradyrhizobium jicamae TaxID=280332 RepID=A0ABS5FK91_9BRAD|nr:Flp family type IVb pilin [Bradyrhizobium jicamae]MBR0797200.1 Flp family type IVb pilin [Bradyrhizobium jicamae]MBR0934886.1 Flp family type IVb pilin [Bradyrhizobium jicamae]